MGDEVIPGPGGLDPGAAIVGYRLEQRIGRGGMATVYRAVDERLGRRVALKVLAAGLTTDHAFRRRFIRESRAAAAVDHPNIIPVYDAGEAAGHLFIAMRYAGGGDMRSLLRRVGPLPALGVWATISQVAAALDAAHAQGLVHRDVKPANMLRDGRAGGAGGRAQASPGHDPGHVYLADFGISRQALTERLTAAGQFVGTLDYAAPEQIEGRHVDGRADLYSLACAAFELLCGAPPFRRSRPEAVIYAQLWEQPPSVVAFRSELPAAVDVTLATALAKIPAQRPDTCAQFAADLGHALGIVPPAPLTAPAGHTTAPAGHTTPPGASARPIGAEPPTRKRD